MPPAIVPGMTPESRTSTQDGHILITGTGRSGTTLLVEYFTALGFDTGHTVETTRRHVDEISRAGLEHGLRGIRGKPLPYVAKAPSFTRNLGGALQDGTVSVRACIVPMRDLYSAAESRRDVARRAQEQGLDPSTQPGALIFGAGSNPKSQERRLAVGFYQLVHTLVLHDIPIYFLRFPDFARGEQDVYAALEPLLAAHGVTAAESAAALADVARPELIHTFAPKP